MVRYNYGKGVFDLKTVRTAKLLSTPMETVTLDHMTNYTIVDMEYATENISSNKTAQVPVNISAEYYEKGKKMDQFNMWVMSPRVKDSNTINTVKKCGIPLDILRSRNYNDLFTKFSSWVLRDKIKRSPIISYGANTDVKTFNEQAKSLYHSSDEIVPIVLQDIERTISEMVNPGGVSLENISKLFNVDYKPNHIGIEDIHYINALIKAIRKARG